MLPKNFNMLFSCRSTNRKWCERASNNFLDILLIIIGVLDLQKKKQEFKTNFNKNLVCFELLLKFILNSRSVV